MSVFLREAREKLALPLSEERGRLDAEGAGGSTRRLGHSERDAAREVRNAADTKHPAGRVSEEEHS